MSQTAAPARPGWVAPLVVLGPGMAIVIVVGSLAAGSSWTELVQEYALVNVAIALTLPIVGGAILARYPRHTVGWLLMWTGLVAPMQILSYLLSVWLGVEVAELPETTAALQVVATASYWIWVPAVFPFITLLPLHFPDGRLPSRRWWWLRVVCLVAIALLTVSFVALARVVASTGSARPPTTTVIEAFATVGYPLLLVAVAGCLGSLVVRLRRLDGVDRQQIRWVLGGAAVTLPLVVGSVYAQDVTEATWPFVTMTVAVVPLPVTMGIAIRRFRLYELDRLVSRGLAYLLLTGSLAAVYVGSVLLLSGLLDRAATDPPAWVVAVATLVGAMLFSPLRSGLQRTIDRRLYRTRLDDRMLAEGFAERLRDCVDVVGVRAELHAVVGRGLQPSSIALWIPARQGGDR